jgi:sugar-specific transcriptional regulator TrmB
MVALNAIEHNALTLSSFGLTIKQAKVYLALVSLGTAPVGEISQASKVRREEVYRILPKLEKMGLIEKTLTTPVKLKATPVDNALSILIREEEEKSKNRLAELRAKKEEFLHTFRKGSKDDRLGSGEQFAIISEKAMGLGKMETMIDTAQTEIEYCVSREKLAQFLKFFSDALKGAAERGVKIRIISNPPNAEDEIPKAFNQAFLSAKSITIRYLSNLPNHFFIIDQNEVLVATNTSGYLADNPLLWSNNHPHIMGYKKLFEELWGSTVESADLSNESEDEKLKTFIKGLKPPNHLILLYENSEAKLKVLLTFVKSALENNEAVVYVCSEASVEEIKAAMLQFAIDVKKHEKTGALKVLDYTQHYIIDGKFDVNNTMHLWSRYYKEALAHGFKGLRVTGETSCFFKHNLVKELVDYEKSLHRNLDIPIVAICAYRADQIMKPDNAVSIYSELVKIHGSVQFTWVDSKLGRIAIS